MKSINLIRYIFNTDVRNIIGDLMIDGVFFCHTLEDELRADGVKVQDKTAIPAGEDYFVTLTYSTAFKKKLPLIYNKFKKDSKGNVSYWIEANGVKFSGVRFHGGNTEEDSRGCPLVCYNTDGKKIWTTASNDFATKFIEGEHYPLVIRNGIFYKGKFPL